MIAVTVLTSMNAEALAEAGVDAPVLDQVLRLAQLTQAAGLDGVVASAQETALIRQACGRTSRSSRRASAAAARNVRKDDQERTMTAAEAIAAGASYIVVGRPIIAAADPRRAAESLIVSSNR